MIRYADDLKPCPFCGNDRCPCVTDPSDPIGTHTTAFVYCPSCGAQGPIEYQHQKTTRQTMVYAMRKWQERR